MGGELSRRQNKQKTPKTKQKKSKSKMIAGGILIVIALLAAVGILWWKTQIKPPDIAIEPEDAETMPEGVQKNDGVYSILVVGTDDVGLNTDTIFVASFDTIQDKINVMSIPRDTMSANVKRSVKKINAAYGVGGKANIDNLKKEIRALIGFMPNYYVVVNLDAFEEIIDAIGGVKIDVPRKMDYDDPYQDLHIHLQAGEQVLKGKDAIGFVRYRKGYVEGDMGRVKAQQLFMTALAQQLAQPATLTKLPALADIISKNMKTDLTITDILWFGQQAIEVDMTNDLQMFTLPGEARYVSNLSYYIPASSEILEMVNAHFNPYDKPITKVDTVSLSTIKSQQSTQSTKKPTAEDEEKDPEVTKEQQQEKSDIAGGKPSSGDAKTEQTDNGDDDGVTDDEPTGQTDDNDNASGTTDNDNPTVQPSETKPVGSDNDNSSDNNGAGDSNANTNTSDNNSSGVVLNEFGQPYVGDDTDTAE